MERNDFGASDSCDVVAASSIILGDVVLRTALIGVGWYATVVRSINVKQRKATVDTVVIILMMSMKNIIWSMTTGFKVILVVL